MNLNLLLLFLIHVFEKGSMEKILVNQFVWLSTGQDKVMSSGPEIGSWLDPMNPSLDYTLFSKALEKTLKYFWVFSW